MSSLSLFVCDEKLFFLDGVLFADCYDRVVVGGRGSYVELSAEQIRVKLVSKFENELPTSVPNGESFYYYWLVPTGRLEKVYWQVRTVTYADYKIGKYYISPDLVRNENSEIPR